MRQAFVFLLLIVIAVLPAGALAAQSTDQATPTCEPLGCPIVPLDTATAITLPPFETSTPAPTDTATATPTPTANSLPIVPTETAAASTPPQPAATETAAATERATATLTPAAPETETPAAIGPNEVTAIATPAVLNAVDQHLAQLWPIAKNKQDNYYANHGHYFQGLLTHSSLPQDGVPAPLENAHSHPTDQQDSWATFLEAQLPGSMLYALKVDVYSGPAGDGWVATLYLVINGQVWSRAGAVGPESSARAYDWRLESTP